MQNAIQTKFFLCLQISELKKVIEKRDSWFSRNRGVLGLVTGLMIGRGLSVGIVHAVYQK